MAIGTSALLTMTSIAISIGAVVASSVTAIVQGAEQAAMADYNEELAEQQAEAQRRNAERARIQAENEAIAKENDTARQAELEREKMERIKALNRVREGASGFAMEGTPLLMQLEAAENIEMNYLEMMRKGRDEAAIIRYYGSNNAYGHEVNALGFESKVKSYGNMSSNATTGGYMQAGSTLLAGAAKATSNYVSISKG